MNRLRKWYDKWRHQMLFEDMVNYEDQILRLENEVWNLQQELEAVDALREEDQRQATAALDKVATLEDKLKEQYRMHREWGEAYALLEREKDRLLRLVRQ